MLVVDCPLKLMQGNSRWRQTTSSPHFSSGIVERAWKSSHARKARRDGESFFLSPSSRLSRLGVIFHARSRFARSTISLSRPDPWGKMGTTRSLRCRWERIIATHIRSWQSWSLNGWMLAKAVFFFFCVYGPTSTSGNWIQSGQDSPYPSRSQSQPYVSC